jgi:primosomal protein N' (replication factor Y)
MSTSLAAPVRANVRSRIGRVAVPSPLPQLFDYRLPAEIGIAPGTRVKAPFGRGFRVGIVVECVDTASVEPHRLKAIDAVIDETPALTRELLDFALWASRYYHHPPGEVLAAALPALLRQGAPARPDHDQALRLTPNGAAVELTALARRAPRQAQLLTRLRQQGGMLTVDALRALDGWRATARTLADKGWLTVESRPAYGLLYATEATARPQLNPAQAAACDAVRRQDGFGCHLLDGVTGSGKTEVYLELVADAVAAGRQALLLVPEIGLTPQLVQRFSRRFQAPIVALHSGLTDRERLNAWLAARDGAAAIVIGTRSAVFTPLARPGLIVVDEEHDVSFKQQDGLRYNARDLAVVRASRLGIPVVLGSATPSLESLYNIERRGYSHLELPQRAGGARMPSVQILDIRGKPLCGGLSEALLARMRRHLDAGGQVLAFLNRRGFAPALLCHACAWVATCSRCDARLTFHQRERRLRCHHCGHERPLPAVCPSCRSSELCPIGQGTERLERELSARFPGIGIVRIDRDSTRRKGAMARLLETAHSGEGRILIGTQMLAKGHHLPDVTLVAIVDADQGLFGTDFRATERLAQQVVQVAGRAGRAERAGEVVIQTHHPEHPLLHVLLRDGYRALARRLLDERRQMGLPPCVSLALLRAEAAAAEAPLGFLEDARRQAAALDAPGVELMGPIPAPMERRAGRYRAQLLLHAAHRQDLQRLLERWVAQLGVIKSARRVRWSLDVDPMEML